ncbi:hypothetical protein [Pimelobacter simplex]|uniref:hypothetical protein n=1 Tax=Nocardioides simplex TaxID=2045 RepID=UPI0020B15EEC|nr:hypothetical protein [Pimelobacter simplex]
MSSLSDRLAAARREAAAQGKHAATPAADAALLAGVVDAASAPEAPAPAPAAPAAAPAPAAPATAAGEAGTDTRSAPGPLSSRAAAAAGDHRPGRRLAGNDTERLEDLKASVHGELIKQLGPHLYDAEMDQDELDQTVRSVLSEVLGAQDRPLSASDRARVTQEITDDILGYGPIDPYLRDPEVSEVMVNGHDDVWLEKDGRLVKAEAHFADEATCAARSTRSCPGSGAASTSPPPWSTPGSPTAAGSTPSSRRWRSTARR